MRLQSEIFQDICDQLTGAISDDWIEIMVNFQIEGNRAREISTYLTKDGEKIVEESIFTPDDFDDLFRELRDHLDIQENKRFTKCVVHIKNNGSFEAKYSYDPVDWDSPGDWNFEVAT